ncbi:hypothetical protein [Kitasatospora aureofaciens]|uniref:hypothetical protein n=1 Tax=Kitasatospora aureofaciens TaxID=1894 RepID=UPI001C495C45|nr:hypothetical protein [Kitasatospora aureofaciens]MBV6702348.1 hypothetical protein [Kitasatospora aureofaciens]
MAGGAGGQCLADELAARSGGGEDVGGALAFDLLDPGELVQQGVLQPAPPQGGDGLVCGLGERGPAARGQREPAGSDGRQAAGLEEQGPGEGGDGLVLVEVAVVEDFGDRGDGGRAGPAGLLAAAELARGAQLKHGGQVGLRLVFGGADPALFLLPVIELVIDAHSCPIATV